MYDIDRISAGAAQVLVENILKAGKQMWKKGPIGWPNEYSLRYFRVITQNSIKRAEKLMREKECNVIRIVYDPESEWFVCKVMKNRNATAHCASLKMFFIFSQWVPTGFSMLIRPDCERITYKHGKKGHKFVTKF